MPQTRRPAAATPRREATEKAVLDATERLLEEGRSFADLSVQDITRAAGISRTAFYFYFADKRDLLLRLTEGVIGELYEQADAWFGDATAGPDRLAAALAAVVALYRRHAVLLRAVMEAAAVDEEIAAFWRSLVGRFVAAAEQRMRDEPGQAAARPASTAFALAWMTERAVQQHLADPSRIGEQELLDAMTGIWVGEVYGR